MPDAEIKRLMKNLEEAINETMSESARINSCIRSIQESGYEAFLIIDATIGFTLKGKGENENISIAQKTDDGVRLRITSEDVKFLKSLKISADVEG
jgi:phosphoribosyl-dephospho-CoA transferase